MVTMQHLMTTVILLRLTTRCYSQDSEGWETVGKLKQVPHDLESYPLHFKLSDLAGSYSTIYIRLYSISDHTKEDIIFTWVKLYLARIPRIKIDGCMRFESSLNRTINYNDEEMNVWTLRKASTSIELDFNGQHAFQLTYSDFGEKCEDFGRRNFQWFLYDPRFNRAVFQYRPHLRDYNGNCSLQEVRVDNARYLKYACLYDDMMWYRCPHTDQYYGLVHEPEGDCFRTDFDMACPGDTHFYQACGHGGCSGYEVRGESTHFCINYVCDFLKTAYIGVSMGQLTRRYMDCNGYEDCGNTVADEQQNCHTNEDLYQCNDKNIGQSILTRKVCDNVCDCWLCDDESFCNGVRYGGMCEWKDGKYIPPDLICTNKAFCYDYSDEIGCTASKHTCKIYPSHPGYSAFKDGIRPLKEVQFCAPPRQSLICSDGFDQVNCTDHERVALSCTLSGFPTNISIFGICQGYHLCDDDYINKCFEPEGGCIIHKSAVCDGVKDCLGGSDETEASCGILSDKVHCLRRVAKMKAKGFKVTYNVPLNWVFDGEIDCMNGEDEDINYWEKCGSGLSARYLDKGSRCSDQLICPEDDIAIDFEELCDKIETCGRENEICKVSRGSTNTWDIVATVSRKNSLKGSPICSEGLKNLRYQTAMCYEVEMSKQTPHDVYFTKTSTELFLPMSKIDCRFIYGENYVYHACTDSYCIPTTSCPLKTIPHDTCVNKVTERVFAITASNELTVVLRRSRESKDGSGKVKEYHNELYPCDNKNCVLYSQVCNLVDDCGDGSDEINCTNHFLCNVSKEYIPLTSKCDGHVDCKDYQDECNSECDSSHKFILRNSFLRGLSWSVGSLATLFNGFNIVNSARDIREIETFGGLMNKCFILLISFGDLLMGVYLVLIAYADLHFGESYCEERYVWLSSIECSSLGIFSTIATQLSLFSMTALSIFRVRTVSMIVQRDISARSIRDMVLIVLAILALSVAVACIPVISVLEDFFVNGLYYHQNPLFTGLVGKTKHYNIFRGYYGYIKDTGMTWSTIRLIVTDMFTSDYGGVEGDAVHFYGNNGVCVFKYLVTPDDPQRIYCLTVLAVNFACFVIISGCYLLIVIRAARSSAMVAGANNPGRRNTGLQAKISAIIFTDFLCWIPLTVICFLHYGEVINAAEWYPVFSITLLPFNSVINPVLYNANIARVITWPGRWVGSSVRSTVMSIRSRSNGDNETNRETTL